jgi:hypothetical protein
VDDDDDEAIVVTLHLAWCFGETFNKFRRLKLISTITLGWLKSNVCLHGLTGVGQSMTRA